MTAPCLAQFHRGRVRRTFILLFATSAALADPPPGYCDSVDATNPATLRTTLHAVIDDHQRFPYTSFSTDTWDILNLADEDPVDDVERYRNDVVFSFQDNRNPFIDNPEWVTCLFVDECETACPQDLDGDGQVEAFDLAILLGSWGPCEGCPADFNGDGVVEAFDLAQVLGAWGLCP